MPRKHENMIKAKNMKIGNNIQAPIKNTIFKIFNPILIFFMRYHPRCVEARGLDRLQVLWWAQTLDWDGFP